MLLISAIDKKYINDLLEKFNYEKLESSNKSEIYLCKYNEHSFIITVTGYGKVCITNTLNYICNKYKIGVILCIGSVRYILNNNLPKIIISESNFQYDIDFSSIGFRPTLLPYFEKDEFNTNSDINECLKTICYNNNINYNFNKIGSSDFIVNNYIIANNIKNRFNINFIDNDSGIIGEYAFLNNIPYSTIKIVLDRNIPKNEENLYLIQDITYKFINEFYR